MKSRSLIALALCICCVFSMMAAVSLRASAASVSYANINDAAKTIADTVESKNALPVKVNCGSTTITPAQFMYLASKVIVSINKGTKSGTLTVPSYTKAPNPFGSITAYNMYKNEYVVRAQKIITFMEGEKAAPNYCTCNNGKLKYQDAVFVLAKILRYYKNNSALPNYCYSANRTWKADVNIITTTTPTTPTVKTVTYANVNDAAKTVADYCESKKALPATVTCGGQSLNMGQMFMLTCQVIGKLNAGTKSGSLEIPTTAKAPSPNGSCTEYNMMKTEYVSVAAKAVTFMQKEKAAPNYCTCNGGKLKFDDAVYALTRVLRYYKANSALPNYTVTKPVSGQAATSTTSSGWLESTAGYEKFLKATTNCQVGNSTLKSVAQTGIKYGGNPTNMYTAAKHLVQYLNDKTSYSYYYNTRKGALGTWNAKCGNCCDMAHLVNACARSVGIPGAYHNTTCRFSDGVYGHVYADLWCGKAYGWKVADIVSSSNYLGYKSNTTISDNYGRMASISF